MRDAHAFADYLAPAAKTEWVVYAKPPFGGAEHVLHYLARYTHRVAISNQRLLSFHEGRVRFLWKDYQHGAAKKTMTLSAEEFIRRFLLHVPPQGLQHIRHYGFLANRYRETKLARCRQLLNLPPSTPQPFAPCADYRDYYEKLTAKSLRNCPLCGKGHMLLLETFVAGSLPRLHTPDTS